MSAKIRKYLEVSEYIDWKNANILKLAKELSSPASSEELTAKNCFEWVRDEIKHSSDHSINPITIQASQVLYHATGYCFAKSHLLAALLRANQLPAGLCYQRLSINDTGAPFTLRGLNAVFLRKHGWYRIDPRGNKEDIDSQFSPPNERLAYSAEGDGEIDFKGILHKPLPVVISALSKNQTFESLNRNLPDTETLNANCSV